MARGDISAYERNRARDLPPAEAAMRRAEERHAKYMAQLIGQLVNLRQHREGTPQWREASNDVRITRKAVRRSLLSLRESEWRAAQRRALQALRAEVQQGAPADRDWILQYLNRRIRALDAMK